MQDMNKDDIFDEDESISLNQKKNQTVRQEVGTAFGELDRSRKIAVIFLAFFSIFLFGAWGFTTKNRINNPLNPKISTKLSLENNQEEENIDNKDSDGDGLTDWEEENLYNTSPYLEDTDSDGVLDNLEIEKGTDPTCREGDDCVNDVLQKDEQAKIEMDEFINKKIEVGISTNTKTDVINEESLSKALKGNSDVATLRKMLLDAGMDEDILNSISDEDLLNSYQEVLQ